MQLLYFFTDGIQCHNATRSTSWMPQHAANIIADFDTKAAMSEIERATNASSDGMLYDTFRGSSTVVISYGDNDTISISLDSTSSDEERLGVMDASPSPTTATVSVAVCARCLLQHVAGWCV